MKDSLSKIRDKILGYSEDNEFPQDMDETEEYLELNTAEIADSKAKVIVKPFIINEFQDIKPTLDALREGYTIALLNIRPLKEKDIVELKRAINKLKKTCDAIEGDIAGFGEDWIVVTPSFAQVHRNPHMEDIKTPTVPDEERIQ